MPDRILVVDDETEYSDLIAYHLRKAGYEVQTAACGLQAVQVLQDSAPDLILLDVMLPGVDGFSICDLVRGTHRLEHVPILFLTACASEEARQIGIESGADDYIVKTAESQVLLALVGEHLRTRNKCHAPPNHGSAVHPGFHASPLSRGNAVLE